MKSFPSDSFITDVFMKSFRPIVLIYLDMFAASNEIFEVQVI